MSDGHVRPQGSGHYIHGDPRDTDRSQPVKGYELLDAVLGMAYDQAARGKGKERHAQPGVPFTEQPMLAITRRVGIGGITYQISKKADEATHMMTREDFNKAKIEFLDIINYAAAGFLYAEERQKALQSVTKAV